MINRSEPSRKKSVNRAMHHCSIITATIFLWPSAATTFDCGSRTKLQHAIQSRKFTAMIEIHLTKHQRNRSIKRIKFPPSIVKSDRVADVDGSWMSFFCFYVGKETQFETLCELHNILWTFEIQFGCECNKEFPWSHKTVKRPLDHKVYDITRLVPETGWCQVCLTQWKLIKIARITIKNFMKLLISSTRSPFAFNCFHPSVFSIALFVICLH